MAFKTVTILFEGNAFEAEVDDSVETDELLGNLTGPNGLKLPGGSDGMELLLHGVRIEEGSVIEIRRKTGSGKVRAFRPASPLQARS